MAFSIFKSKPDTFDFNELRVCKTCGHNFRGRYCNNCGEKVLEPDEYSAFSFLESLLSVFTPLEGKFLNSTKLMIARPGQLSRNIADGMRVPYMKMLSFFFVVNFLYFLFPIWDVFNSKLVTQMNAFSYSETATRVVKDKIAKDNISLADFEKKYEEHSTDQSKLFLVVLPFAFTAVLYIVNFRRRLFFFEHMLVSLELYSYYLLFNIIMLSSVFLGIVWLAAKAGYDFSILIQDRYFYLVTVATVAYFILVSQFTFYKQKWYLAIPKTLVLLYAFKIGIDLYRQLLFYITVWTM